MKIPDIGAERVVEDPVHGGIPVTGTEHSLIQLPLFTRLHRVRQNSMAYMTYPGALTSRFGHVLGSMFIGSKIATQVLRKMNEDDFGALFPALDVDRDVETLIKSVRLACLFHDAGHGPFSHASEDVMASLLSEEEKREAVSLLGNKPAIHEYFSYKLIQTEDVRAVADPDTINMAASLLVEHPASQTARDNKEGFAVFRKMVSGQLDADRADYLARDSLMSGVPYGQIDYDRILTNMAAVSDPQGRYELAVHNRALGAVEHMLSARFYMYQLLYRHHKVATTDDLIERAIKQMIKDGVLKKDLLHWKAFEKGLGVDDYVIDLMAYKWSRGLAEYAEYRGLWDRRYLPVSLLKHPDDYVKFAKHTRKFTQRDIEDGDILAKIAAFQASPNAETAIADTLDPLGEPLSSTHVMIRLGSWTPYWPMRSTDNIWLYTEGGSVRLRTLTRQSVRANNLSERGVYYPSVYFFCTIPGLQRRDVTTDMKEKILDAIIKAAFS